MEEKAEFLPISLTYFTASQQGNAISFKWQTASETNNDYFTIEYSLDGINFYEVANVDGAGTTSETRTYNYVWNPEEYGLFYSRLKQTDYNGEYSYSNVIAIDCKDTMPDVYYQNGKIMHKGNPLRF